MNNASSLAQSNTPHGFEAANFNCSFLDASGPYFIKRLNQQKIIGIRIDKGHINHVQTAHGGVLATLADVALSYQVHVSATPPLPVVTISLTTNFISGARHGEWVEARARIEKMGRRVAHCSADIRTEERMLMTATGVFSIVGPQSNR
ncbi:MAG: PaaI family thioesterase [Pseudomonadota bacterium]